MTTIPPTPPAAGTPRKSFWARYGYTIRQFFKFGVVGGSGVLVNLLVVIICKRIYPHYEMPLFSLFGTRWNLRLYHLYATLAFVVANTWNYQLNRMWTFKSRHHGSWWRGFFPFLAAGLAAFVVNLIVQTLLINPTSPIALPRDIFDDSNGFRTLLYWASLIGTLVATPFNFVLSKLWVFAGVRAKNVRAKQSGAAEK